MSERRREDIYFGLERPLVRDWGGRLAVALVVPGDTGLALSALGWQAVWNLLQKDATLAVERVFCRPGQPPLAEDSGRPLADFPVIAFSLAYEEDYLTAVAALDAAGIPPAAADRSGFPILLAGGPLAFLNPTPILPALDMSCSLAKSTMRWKKSTSTVRVVGFCGKEMINSLGCGQVWRLASSRSSMKSRSQLMGMRRTSAPAMMQEYGWIG